MNKSTALFIMSAIYVAPHVDQTSAVILSVCFLIFAFAWAWIESKEKSE